MESILGEIRKDIETLLRERSEKQQQLSNLTEEVSNLQNALAEKDQLIAVMEETIKTQKIAKSLNGGDEKTDAKLKINELVREIDKCIALLHK
ncbi:MAG: hypothetical protein P8H59_10060 [Flavobacteriales bacterium]|nr:hypothetical protein [Flavobacteriales bacterium]MDG1781286.1 hypothetical protein [Flavobacteriales bacterium]MDG2245883.1 hypothetical protein [Flavobacteriales bacterium]